MKKNNYKKIFICAGLFLISLFALPKISEAADIAASASRTSGVAPLSVHFNADLTASSPTERSFHDLEYSWDFGDASAGNWGTDNKSKNLDKGPVSAHVYETPGTFTTTLTVRNATGIIDTKTFEITVTDPDVVFSGTKTTCISTGSDFTGCPTGATHRPSITTTLPTELANATDAGERVLLRRGDSWTISSTPSFPNNYGPVSIGAYGTCTSPDAYGICANAPSITLSGSGTSFLNFDYKHDWRMSDLTFSGTRGTTGSAFAGTMDPRFVLGLRIKSTNGTNGVINGGWRNDDTEWVDGNALVSSYISGMSDHCLYIGGDRWTVMGNYLVDSVDHTFRMWNAYQAVISHNIIGQNGPGQHSLKLHGPSIYGHTAASCVGTFAQCGNGGQRHLSQFIVITNNAFGPAGSSWLVGIAPQNASYDEPISDVIFEKNKIIADLTPILTPANIGVWFASQYTTARNNIIDGKGSDLGFEAITVGRRGIEPFPTGIRIYNNTMYTPETHPQYDFIAVRVDSGTTDAIIRNNYVSAPNATNKYILRDNSSGGVTQSNNVMTDLSGFLDPNNSSPLLRNFSLTSNSTQAIDQGIAVPVFDDFTGQSRTGTYDIGAYEYLSGGDMTAPSAPANLSVL